MFQSGLPFSPKSPGIKELMPPGASQRRAVAKFHGLLTSGRNRKKRYLKSLFDREEVGDRWGLPEEQL